MPDHVQVPSELAQAILQYIYCKVAVSSTFFDVQLPLERATSMYIKHRTLPRYPNAFVAEYLDEEQTSIKHYRIHWHQ